MSPYQNNITSAVPAGDPEFIREVLERVRVNMGEPAVDAETVSEKIGEALASYALINRAQTDEGYGLDDDMIAFVEGYLAADGFCAVGSYSTDVEAGNRELLGELADVSIGEDHRDSAEPLEIDITIPIGDTDLAGLIDDIDAFGTDSPADDFDTDHIIDDYDLDELMERLDVCDVDELMEKLGIDDLGGLRDALDIYEDDDFSNDRFGFDSEAHDFDMDGFDDRFH